MAFPVILVNSATGSDSAASGAGPATAVTEGSITVMTLTGSDRIGLFGAAADLSGVATDGSHAIYVAYTTAGVRNFGRILGVKNTSQSVNADATNGSVVVNNTNTTDMAVGDLVTLGAGVYTIANIVSGTSLWINSTYTGATATVTLANPKQVTYGTGEAWGTRSQSVTYAIGGKRANMASATTLKLHSNNGAAGDAMPGWIMEVQSGHTETIAGPYQIRRGGDVTDGPIVIRGEPGAATRPVLTFTNNSAGFQSNSASVIHIEGFDMVNTNAAKTASIGLSFSGSSGMTSIRDMRIGDATNKFWKGIVGSANVVENCEVAYCASDGINPSSGGTILNCWVHDNGGHGILHSGGSVNANTIDCIVAGNAGDGIRITINQTAAERAGIFTGNTIHGNTSDGIEMTSGNSRVFYFVINNNNITGNGGYGLNMSGISSENRPWAIGSTLNNNNWGTGGTANTSGKCNVTLTDGKLERNSQSVDPGYADASNGDFTVGANVKAIGHPTVNIGHSSTRSYVDIGAQRKESTVSKSRSVNHGGP